MKIIYEALMKRKMNTICMGISLGVYTANKYLFKKTFKGVLGYICVNHLNDFMCPLFFLGIAEILLIIADIEVRSFWGIMLISCASGFVWEVVGPIINPNSVGDFIDFICYIAGGGIYYGILRRELTHED